MVAATLSLPALASISDRGYLIALQNVLVFAEHRPGKRLSPQPNTASMLRNWLLFLIYAVVASGIAGSMLIISYYLSKRPTRKALQRGLPFESGVASEVPERQRFTIGFYLTAMLFLLFDIEIVFLYPLAVILDKLAWFGFAELGIFIGLLAVAYVYVWRKGALEWE
jgi:NADH-quinone oxidoreductase subunit A